MLFIRPLEARHALCRQIIGGAGMGGLPAPASFAPSEHERSSPAPRSNESTQLRRSGSKHLNPEHAHPPIPERGSQPEQADRGKIAWAANTVNAVRRDVERPDREGYAVERAAGAVQT